MYGKRFYPLSRIASRGQGLQELVGLGQILEKGQPAISDLCTNP